MAGKLVDAGCRSVEDLEQPTFNKMLSATMRVSLYFKDHLDKRATRDDAESVLVCRLKQKKFQDADPYTSRNV